jgi:serine/threonine protein kinase
MFNPGDSIDNRYIVEGVCNSTGGMGTLYFVQTPDVQTSFQLVLKECRDPSEEIRQRFRREVKLLLEFQGNSKVIEIVDHNINCDPPYFVMRYYPGGDLSRIASRIRGDIGFQEATFCQMIDCLGELHARGKFHRDVKPQNYLVHGDAVVIADFGLSKALDGNSAATRSSQYWGTLGYLPPEFLTPAGFKNASVASDIFMLGKTFYSLLSGRDPTYLSPDGVPSPIYAVIERCCQMAAADRYPDLPTLRQRLIAAYDVLLHRTEGPGKAGQLLGEIKDQPENGLRLGTLLTEFCEALAILPEESQTKLIFDLDDDFFRLLVAKSTPRCLLEFLKSYELMVRNSTYGWSYAETIADRMRIIFSAQPVTIRTRTLALELAIVAAVRQNRFAAMDTCQAMIKSVRDDNLGHSVAEMLLRYSNEHFISSIEPLECPSNAIGIALAQLRGQRERIVAGT